MSVADPIDLAHEQRIRRTVAKIGAALDASPGLAERTAAALSGELPCPDLEGPMAKTKGESESKVTPTAMRIPTPFLARAEALAERLTALRARDPLASTGTASRHEVLVLAVDLGLDEIEKHLTARESILKE